MQNILRNILVILLFGMLFLPMVQLSVNLFDEPPLEGIGQTTIAPALRWSSWQSGKFQDSLTEYATQHCGFHNTLVRLNNQYYYSAYHTALANGVIIGQDNYLYDRAHIAAYTGSDFLGEDTLRARMEEIRDLRDILAKKGIKLMLTFVPGKATGTPEHLPVGTPPPGKQTNFKSYRRLADSLDVPALDLITWYQAQLKTSPYSLYPSGGIHWSVYCSHLAADTLIGYISQLMGTVMNRPDSTTLELSPVPRGQDIDIDRGMNILFPHTGSPMAYPTWRYTRVAPQYSVMTVGDSYYFRIFTDYSGAFFAHSSLWFYYNELHTWGNMVTRRNHEVDLIKQIEAQDLIILYAADANLAKFSWGFVHDALKIYRDPARREAEIQRLTLEVQNDPNWLKIIQQKALSEGLPLDTMIRRDAIFTLEHRRSP